MFRIVLILVASLQAVLCIAQDSPVFKARREILMKEIEGSVAVLQGAPATRAYIPFRQDNNFYYLTGVEAPDALLLIDGLSRTSILFLPAQDKKAEQWEGAQPVPGPEAQRQTGMDAVLDRSQFGDELKKRKATLRTLYVPLLPYELAATSRDRAQQFDAARREDPWDGRISREEAFENKLKAKIGKLVSVKNLSPILDKMRCVKDAQEIAQLREAGRMGALGLKEAIRSAKPDMYEYQLAALAQFLFLWHGASGPSYFPMAGSGPNSCVLHYSSNNRKMAAGDIVVMDLGADYRYYASDITRTFPVSGRFSEEQAKTYDAVLQAQKAAIRTIRPGSTFSKLNDAVYAVMKSLGYEKYLMHAVSHYIGLSTHDVGEPEPFVPGVVITVEPGIYMPDRNLGIRIEDTVLVTKDGYEILTGDVPKEIAEIENLMSEKGVADAIKE